MVKLVRIKGYMYHMILWYMFLCLISASAGAPSNSDYPLEEKGSKSKTEESKSLDIEAIVGGNHLQSGN